MILSQLPISNYLDFQHEFRQLLGRIERRETDHGQKGGAGTTPRHAGEAIVACQQLGDGQLVQHAEIEQQTEAVVDLAARGTQFVATRAELSDAEARVVCLCLAEGQTEAVVEEKTECMGTTYSNPSHPK